MGDSLRETGTGTVHQLMDGGVGVWKGRLKSHGDRLNGEVGTGSRGWTGGRLDDWRHISGSNGGFTTHDPCTV